jgi:hypothetical protein
MNGGMVVKACLALLVGVSLSSCSPFDRSTSTMQPTPGDSAFGALRAVPLKLPGVEPGQSCSPSQLKQLGPHLQIALGGGPVFAFNVELSDPEHLNKVVWAANPSYSGPIRIRGGRIDGSGQVLFESFDNRWRGAPVKTVEGTSLYPELDIVESHSTFPNVPTGWRMWPSIMYLASAGCYGWQVDGLGFTEVFTFHSLDLVALPAGAACPNSPQQVAHDLSPSFGNGPAVGAGPVFALMGEMQEGVLRYSPRTDGLAYSKVLWIAKPAVTGNVAIRGRQIDAPINTPNWIGFGKDENPDLVLQWEIGSQGGWASLPSEIRLRAPGCYAFQADSQRGTQVITFQVVEIS